MKKKKTQRARKRLVLSLMLIALAITAWGSTDVTTTINGVSGDVTVTVLKGWDVDNIDNIDGISGDFNRPFYLEKDKYYYFGPATKGEYAIRTVLWDKFEFKDADLTIDGEKATGVVLRFKGISGYYRIRKVSELTNRDGTDNAKFDNTTFLRVVPLKKNFATDNSIDWDNLKNSDRTAKFQDRDTAFPNFSKDNDKDSDWGYGCLYIAGGPGFGYGEYDKYVGWDKRWMPDGYNQNYILIDNQMWIPSPEKNLYKFRLQAGGNISNDPNKAFNVKFYLNNYMKKFIGDNYNDQSMDWTKYELVNSWRGDLGKNVTSYPYLMHLKDGRDCFYISGNVPGTENDEQKNSPDWNNGNFRTTTIGFDSDMPSMPEGYTFEITLDLREKNPADWSVVDSKNGNGIEVDIEQVKSENDVMYKYVNSKYMKVLNENAIEQIGYNDEGVVELYLGYYGHDETADKATKQGKRIKLRDALRLDYGIRYANQYDKDYDKDNSNKKDIKSYEKMIIHGELSVDDMEYISWLCNNNLLTELDLSDAVLPGNIIPAPSTIDGINSKSGASFDFGGASTSLKKVIMPTNGVSGIGKNAFKGCKSLENVAEIVKNTKGYIGESAFEGCTNENSTIIDVENVTSIGKQAFKDCKQIVKFTVPNKVVETVTTEPQNVGTPYKSLYVYGGATIEAEYFNKGRASSTTGNGGYYDATNGKDIPESAMNQKRNDAPTVSITDEGDNNNNKYVYVGYLKDGDFLNYTFNCTEAGLYKIYTNYATKVDDNNLKGTVYIDCENNNKSNGKETSLPNTDWQKFDKKELCLVELTEGLHVMRFSVNNSINLDKFIFEKVDKGSQNVTPGNNKGTTNTATNKAVKSESNSFEGIIPNNCEVKFTGDDNSNNYAEYRKQDGWMYLLTKDLDEDKAYSCVNQLHANAKHAHIFKSNAWYSIVLPFDVNAKILASVKSDDKAAFDKAAIYKYDNFSGVYTDENGNKTTGLPKAHFIYFDDEPLLKDASGEETVKAGTPFLIHCANATSNNIYMFEDVHTICSKTGSIANEAAMTVSHNGGINFIGNLYETPKQLGNTEWFVSEYYYHSNNAKLKPYRAWLSPATDNAAKGLAILFDNGYDDSIITGISVIDTNEKESNNGIYNLNGQKVRQNSNDKNGLPNGVYIIENKRIVIK